MKAWPVVLVMQWRRLLEAGRTDQMDSDAGRLQALSGCIQVAVW